MNTLEEIAGYAESKMDDAGKILDNEIIVIIPCKIRNQMFAYRIADMIEKNYKSLEIEKIEQQNGKEVYVLKNRIDIAKVSCDKNEEAPLRTFNIWLYDKSLAEFIKTEMNHVYHNQMKGGLNK